MREDLLSRTATALWPLLQQAAAAVLAWVLAVSFAGHEDPFFAPVAAVVALNASLGRRGSNAVRLLVGVVVGILVGEVALVLAGDGAWTLGLAALAAMAAARIVEEARIVTAQAAVSAILVVAFGDATQGLDRLLDALIGAGVALVFSQVLFVPEPLRLLRRAERTVLAGTAEGLQLGAEALDQGNGVLADRALSRLRGLRTALVELGTMQKASGRVVRHAQWRGRGVTVVYERERADQLELLAVSCIMLLRTAWLASDPQRRTLGPGVRRLAQVLEDLAADPSGRDSRQKAAEHALDLGRWAVERDADTPARTPAATSTAVLRMVALDVMVFAGVPPDQAVDAIRTAVDALTVDDPPGRKHPSLWRRLLARVRNGRRSSG